MQAHTRAGCGAEDSRQIRQLGHALCFVLLAVSKERSRLRVTPVRRKRIDTMVPPGRDLKASVPR